MAPSGDREELAFGHSPSGDEPGQARGDDGDSEAVVGGHIGGVKGCVGPGVSRQQVTQGVRHRVEERVRHTGRQSGPQGIAQSAGILDGGPSVLVGHPHSDRLTAAPQGLEPVGDLVRGNLRAGACAKGGERQRSKGAQQIGDIIGVACRPLAGEALQLGLGAADRVGVEEIAQGQPLGSPEELGQEIGIKGEGGGAALRQRCVALVEELGDVAKQQRSGEGGRLRGLDVDHGDRAGGQIAHDARQRRHVEDVLDALAHGLERDGERRILAGDLEQLSGALALLPQGLAAIGTAPGEEQGAGRALSESRREQGGSTDLRGDDPGHLIGVEGDQIQDLGTDGLVPGACRATIVSSAEKLIELDVGKPQDDPVVAVHGLHVDPESLPHACTDGQGPGRVDLSTEGGVDRHAPIPELVAETLDNNGAVVGEMSGVVALFAQIGQQVVGGPGIEPGGLDPRQGWLRSQPTDLADERVALPERQPARYAGCRCHEHAVVGDVLDPPGAGPKSEQVTDARLVDHLLVELTDTPARTLRPRKEDGEQPAIGNGAPRGHRQVLGAPAAAEHPCQPIPGDPSP